MKNLLPMEQGAKRKLLIAESRKTTLRLISAYPFEESP